MPATTAATTRKSAKAPKAASKKTAPAATEIDLREERLFRSLIRDGSGTIPLSTLVDALEQSGLRLTDDRLKESVAVLNEYPNNAEITFSDFCKITRPNILLIERALRGQFVIPSFSHFRKQVEEIFVSTATDTNGAVADYIPQLGRVNPDQYGVSICTIDGQRHSLGDSEKHFCVQSTCKPINYCIALEANGASAVHDCVGREPSGRGFNELTLNHDGRPHNPMINAGAIMSCSLIKPEIEMADRFDYVMDRWTALAGDEKPTFSNSVYLSERQTADRNFALGYFMREHQAFPAGTELIDTLEFYFQCCSIEVTADMMSVVAATLANGGVCPTTGKRIFDPKTVQHCLSLMYSCGMYDFSGEFAFSIGLPAKSGVSGAMMIVIPNVMGICTWSPRLDRHGNSVRGIQFCKSLVETFNFHNYDNLTGLTEKSDPRQVVDHQVTESTVSLIWAASKGDLTAIRHLAARGVSLNSADYDGRTPLHLAASEGHQRLVEYFIHQGVDLNPKDRWGGTPLSDAKSGNHKEVHSLLKSNGAI